MNILFFFLCSLSTGLSSNRSLIGWLIKLTRAHIYSFIANYNLIGMFGIQKNRHNRNRINNYSTRSILMSQDSTLTHTQKSAMMSFTTDSVRSLSAKRTSFCTRNEALLLATSSLKSFSNCSKTFVINVSIKRKQINPGYLNCSKFVNTLYTIVILIENNQYIRPRV